MAYQIFISYSTKDLPVVNRFREMLDTNPDIKVFIAEYSIVPGESLPLRISQAIETCDMFLLLWSENSKQSDWVSQEIGIAKNNGKYILPVMLNKGLTAPGFISDIKYLSAHDDTEGAVREVNNLVKTKSEKFNFSGPVALVAFVLALIMLLTYDE